MISVGDKLPQATFMNMTANGPAPLDSTELFAGKTVGLFALPGAFTPTCSNQHLPGYVAQADALRAKGVDLIICLSVNDAFVMDAWGKDQNVGDKVMMIADGNGTFTNAVGLEMDGTGFGMGMRSQRYSMIIRDGVLEQLNIETDGGKAVESGAETMLGQL